VRVGRGVKGVREVKSQCFDDTGRVYGKHFGLKSAFFGVGR
jgi:hypothetical protein